MQSIASIKAIRCRTHFDEKVVIYVRQNANSASHCMGWVQRLYLDNPFFVFLLLNIFPFENVTAG